MKLENMIKEINLFLLRNNINNEYIKTDNSAYLYTLHFLILNTVKTKKLLKLEDEISFLLGVKKVRIKLSSKANTITIEIPKNKRDIVRFKDCIETNTFKNAKGELPFILGENLTGNIVVKDLTEMTHLLIAGQTGSGKSVFVNTLINCLILNKNCNFIMIDTKKVELSIYNKLHSLLFPICTDVEQTITALTWTINEMDKRYTLLEKSGFKDINEYNKKKKKKMKRIVIIVDEFADLMMKSSKQIEQLICRIAQLSRACGIHLVIATQRPSREVLTGLIKVNLPTRIAFSVNSKINSRIILDENGAEQLLGKGDMLYLQAGKEKERIQSAYITDTEIKKCIKLANQEIPKTIKQKDILLETTLKYLKTNKKDTLTTMDLQDFFKITELQASNLMETLEKQKIVGKYSLFSPRKVFLNKIE